MATIGRISGPALYADLDRQGVDLKFTTSGNTLLGMDFANFAIAINGIPTADKLTVYGSAKIDDLSIAGTTVSSLTDITLAPAGALHLGDVAKVKITGGNTGLVLSTDGAGNLSWLDLGAISQSGGLAGNVIALGTPLDGSLTAYSAYKYFTPTTTVTDAVDNLNQVLLNVYRNTYVGDVNFTANITSGPSPITVQFTPTVVGNPTSYYWEFGDGGTSTDFSPTHTYSSAAGGVYDVYVKASNTSGTLAGVGFNGDPLLAQGSYADTTKPGFIVLYTPTPMALFTLDTVSIDSGSTVTLTNLSTNADSYVVFWGDGTQDSVSDNASAGAPGFPITHTYTNAGGDTRNVVTVSATSSTAGPGGVTVTSSPTAVSVYSAHSPAFTVTTTSGPNQHVTLPYGLQVGMVNQTASDVGPTATFPGNRYEWVFGDGATLPVNAGSGIPGDVSVLLNHYYLLADPTVGQTFEAVLRVINGHTLSPFTSAPVSITVTTVPTATFEGTAATVSDKVGDTAQVGYLATDLQGTNRARILFTNQSVNADTYAWDFGDSTTSTMVAPPHTYTAEGVYTVSLLAHGPNSQSPTDDTLVKTGYIEILPAPPLPPLLSTKTLTVPSQGFSPLLAANATNNSASALPAPGTPVSRAPLNVSPTTSTVVDDAYNADAGTLTAMVNGVASGSKVLTGANDQSTIGSLLINADRDAHLVDPTVYPSLFYNVFSASVSHATPSLGAGYSTYQLTHTATGSTNLAGFVVDDVEVIPTLDTTAVTMSTVSLGIPKYESGIPYFNLNGVVGVSGVKVTNWIGQTYANTLPLTAYPSNMASGSGQVIVTQTKTYAQLDGSVSYLSAGIPMAETGNTVSYTLGQIPININGTAVGAGKIAISLQNVVSQSATVELPTNINVYSGTQSAGVNELDIPVSPTLGANYTDNGLRIRILGTGPTPSYVGGFNYYTDGVFAGNIDITATDEAVVRYGQLQHDVTDYSTYLPVGPDLSSHAGTQYFRFAFRRAQLANFTINYTGKISGLYIAAPGTAIDATSTLNGWLNATIPYQGAGVPGANAMQGGNGSNGCAKTAGDVIVPGQVETSRSAVMTLGSENSSNSLGNQIFVTIALNAGDYITYIGVPA